MACYGRSCGSSGGCGPFTEGRYPKFSDQTSRVAYGAVVDNANRTFPPVHIPGYSRVVRGEKFRSGKPYEDTHDSLIANLQRNALRRTRKPVWPDPCRGNEVDLRARLHMVQGEIDSNPCSNTQWNVHNKFCIPRPSFQCPGKLTKRSQHGYTSRLSVYDNGDDVGLVSCKSQNLNPCPERIPIQWPFLREYKEISNFDPSQEYSQECRHLRLPPVKPKTCDCLDEEYLIPAECLRDYQDHGYVRKPTKCECLPLSPTKPDSEVCYLRGELNPCATAERAYFQDPTNWHRWFKSGYTGHCPVNKFRIGETYDLATRNSLNVFTKRYMFPHLVEKCPVYLDPDQYCCNDQCYERTCCPRKTYDGHFHEERMRRNLPCPCPQADMEEPDDDPLAICIAPTEKREQPIYAPC